MNNSAAVKHEKDAVDRAGLVTKLQHLASMPATAAAHATKDLDLPFLGPGISKLGQVWEVTLNKVSLLLRSSLIGFPDRGNRLFSVHLAASTGQLLSIQSTFQGRDPDLKPRPNAAYAEEQLRQQEEEYLGFPEEPPKHPFLDILNLLLSRGIANPLLAKEVDGIFVRHRRRGSEPYNAWIITLRGIPPVPVKGPPGLDPSRVPVWQRNQFRNVINDTTGQVLYSTNVPLSSGD